MTIPLHAVAANAPPVLPCWIHGRAFISLTPRFADVRDRNGRILRRTPCCGKDEIMEAQASAWKALPSWKEKSPQERRAFLAQWGALLETYAAHFARLLYEETRKSEAAATREVAAAVARLKAPPTDCDGGAANAGVIPCAWGKRHPLADAVRLFTPVLAAGGAIIANPCAAAPGAAFALCELSARAGAPPGIINLVFAPLARDNGA